MSEAVFEPFQPAYVGEACGVCSRPIESARDAEPCVDCGLPVHHFCGRETPGIKGRCPTCGANLKARSRRTRRPSPPAARRETAPAPRLGLLHYFFSTEGRAGRLSFVAHHLIDGAVTVAIVGAVIQFSIQFGGEVFPLALLVSGIIVLASFWSATAIGIRRLHDLGHSGSACFLSWIPGVNLLFFAYLVLAPGNPGDNEYGPPPGGLFDFGDAGQRD